MLRLFESFSELCERRGICTDADIIKAAAEGAPAAKSLRDFGEIIYYGFYDLTQLQLDLFQAVSRNFPTTLFFPLLRRRPAHAAWSFAERFYERYVEGRSAGSAE